jgi:hypothetical protein
MPPERSASTSPRLDSPVQLHLELQLPLDPVQWAQLDSPERGRRYRELGLDQFQIAAAEDAVRQVLRREYRGLGR